MPLPRVVVVGLGPGPSGLITAASLDAIAATAIRFVRTTRHPSAALVDGASSFDHVYERAEQIEDVYPTIVEALVAAATEHGGVLYAVPGSPMVAERTVELLVADERVETIVHHGMSFAELAWVRLGVDPVAAGVRLVDGHAFAVTAAGERGPLLVAQCDSVAVLSDIKLAVDGTPPEKVVVLQRLGLPDERVTELDWSVLDQEVEPDHLTSLYIPELAEPVAAEMMRLAEVGRRLREQCPWDREQTHESLMRYLLEEAYEVIDAVEQLSADDGVIAGADAYTHLEEELGDVLFQVVFHSTIAAEAGAFTLADVARGITDKLVHRHPHVFGDVAVAGAHEVLENWETIKRAEKGRTSALDGVTPTLPALMLAAEIVKKASRVDVHVTVPASLAVAGDVTADDIGAALLAVVAASRRAGVDAESALRGAALRLADEARAHERTQSVPPG